MDAILLIGHGSRLSEANNALKQVASMVKDLGNVPLVETAFLQFAKPDFFEAVSTCVSSGARKIIVHPYFLYKGRHFEEDLTEMVGKARKRYSDIEFILTEPLGVHENIAKVVLERSMKDIKPVKILKPHEIEEKSFEIITREMGKTDFRDIETPIVKRVIHATGDFDFAKNMRFHSDAVEVGIKAIKKGMDILVDVKMVEAGINKRLLQKWRGKVICKIQNTEHRLQTTDNPPIPPLNKGGMGGVTERGGEGEFETDTQTRAEQGIESAVKENNNIGIVAIGNAPTALYRTMKLIRDNGFNPELVVGVPVGFVKAVESKEVLLHMEYPFITSLGRKGGSTVAAAIVNALLKIAEGG
ncbi:MAG: precorrin-8X methylmutase [Thermodesulfovibrionia bacterium]|nr:precorrin-8X methylmutase [Thermodesulfovibrionia bacterium]